MKRGKLPCAPAVGLESLESRLMLALPPMFQTVGVGAGGSFFSPSFSPFNSSELYVATDMSDLYHTTDLGNSWTVMDFSQIQGSNRSAVQFTSDPNILYSLGPSGQVIKTTNGGTTWSTTGSFGNGSTLIADGASTTRLVVSTYSTISFSGNGGSSYTTVSSTTGFLAGAFFDGSNIYVATDRGIMVSTNNGASFSAATWGTNIPAAESIGSFAGAKSGSTTRFYVVTADSGSVYPGAQGLNYAFKGVYTIDLGQTNWTKKTNIPADQPGFVAMTRGDINTVYLAGGNGWPTVDKSTNGGSTWTSLFKTTNNQNIQTGWQGYNGDGDWSFGEFAMGFAVSPTDPNKVIITDMGGAHISTDGGTTWRAVYENPADLNPAGSATPTKKAYHGNGMEPTTVWDLTWASSTNLFASFTDIGAIRSADGGSSWSFNYSGLTLGGRKVNTTYYTLVQPGTGNLYAAVSNTHDIYESEAYQQDGHVDAGTGAVLYSTSQGSSWSLLHDFGHPVVWEALDPNNPNKMYVSVANYAGSGTAGGIYVTSDLNLGASSHWTKLANPPRTEGHPWNIVVLGDSSVVATYATHWTSDGVRSPSSGVFLLPNGSSTWTDTTANVPAMQYACHDITIDPSDSTGNTWYVGVWFTTNNVYWPEGGLYKTTNRGQTWSLVPGSAAMGKVSQVAFNPLNNNEMYITTGNDGLWFTSNAHAASPTFARVTTYPFAEPIRVVFNPYDQRQVWVTSFGNGLRVGYDSSGLLPGDINKNGSVRFDDYIILANNFGQSALGWSVGDLNCDGRVNFADYVILANNFGQGTSSSSSVAQGSSSSLLAASLPTTRADAAKPATLAAVSSVRPAGAETIRQFFGADLLSARARRGATSAGGASAILARLPRNLQPIQIDDPLNENLSLL